MNRGSGNLCVSPPRTTHALFYILLPGLCSSSSAAAPGTGQQPCHRPLMRESWLIAVIAPKLEQAETPFCLPLGPLWLRGWWRGSSRPPALAPSYRALTRAGKGGRGLWLGSLCKPHLPSIQQLLTLLSTLPFRAEDVSCPKVKILCFQTACFSLFPLPFKKERMGCVKVQICLHPTQMRCSHFH